MKQIGISIYPDFYHQDKIKEQIDTAKELGYQRIFTSILLHDLGFDNTNEGISEDFLFLFKYAKKQGLTLHVDVNNRMLERIKATPDNLKPIADLNIPVIRLDGGFSYEEIALMTNNPYHIMIEENASNLNVSKLKINQIIERGNINQYMACHNFFPRIDTGLSFEDALSSAKLFNSHGIKVGIFIGSLYSATDLNHSGSSIVTVENHRYQPSDIQAMSLLAHPEFSYVMFGDSNPRKDELEAVAAIAKNDCAEYLESKYKINKDYFNSLTHPYCIEIPVYLDQSLDPKIKKNLTSTVFLSRNDQPEKVLRTTQTRTNHLIPPMKTIDRIAYSITIDNSNSGHYMGELQIMLEDLPAATYANVIGMVKPYAKELVELAKYANVPFVLRED